MDTALGSALTDKLQQVPELPGCYLIKDAQGRVLYVGKARSLRHRLRQHFSEGRPMHPWHERMLRRAADFEYVVTNSELEALILEAVLIKKHRPRFNLRLADDKSYPYLVLTDELYPRLMILRDLPEGAASARPGQRRGFHDPKRHVVHSLAVGRIFGPYADARAMRRTMGLVSQLFGLRTCRKALTGDRVGKPCLNYHLKRCVGPCTGEVSAAAYGQLVRQAALFLSGHTEEVVQRLQAEMQAAAERLEFERAAILRDRLRAVQRSTQEQVVVKNALVDWDVLGAAQEADRAVVTQLVVRAGKLVQTNQLVLIQADRHSPGEALGTFMSQHYAHGGEVPREILVSHELEEQEQWERLLAELRGGPVRLARPRRGEKRRLVDMAVQNATVAVGRLVASEAESKRVGRAAVEDLGQALNLAQPPRRIECYDVSHTGGHLIVGSMVVFSDGLPDKKNYRHFRIRTVTAKPDDYAALREVLRRRFQRALQGHEKFLPLPELVLVDGGRGQLSVAAEVVSEFGLQASVALAALAKQQEEVYGLGAAEPLDLSSWPRAHFLLQRVRDEAHRFALTHHRSLRAQAAAASLLDEIPGIGRQRRSALLRAFPSLRAMAEASVDELAAVPGMNRPLAERLRSFLLEKLNE
jgi:excinuclease ABC subunit C